MTQPIERCACCGDSKTILEIMYLDLCEDCTSVWYDAERRFRAWQVGWMLAGGPVMVD